MGKHVCWFSLEGMNVSFIIIIMFFSFFHWRHRLYCLVFFFEIWNLSLKRASPLFFFLSLFQNSEISPPLFFFLCQLTDMGKLVYH